VQQSAPVRDSVPESQSCSFADPVFVLCNGRSGSTLLRFLLDAHPELACPPETNLPALCAQLATVWSLIEGAPLSANRGDEPPEIPDAAIAGVRQTMDRMVGSYLSRRGKKRYCDKSLGTARFAELLMRVYPEARFLCLYRHPMDVIASGLEACPWGLNGYGFDPYIATTPGNAVMALARFWADNAAETLAAEEQFPDRCLRVRYEDLVTDPERMAAEVFAFLDAAQAPGISAECFTADRERFGPGDYKIWYTSAISAGSVGRGWSVPAGMIAPQVLAGLNELAAKLGYLQVDGDWGTTAPPLDLRVPQAAGAEPSDAGAVPAPPAAPAAPAASGLVLSQLLGHRLREGIRGIGPDLARYTGPHAAESFVTVWIPADPNRPAEHWLVDLRDRSVSLASQAAQQDSDWDVVGSAAAWEQVINGRLNISVAIRACQLRYCDDGDGADPLASDSRIGLLARLLGLACL
jgi:protein-tyrosine sulfotransferase